MRLGQKNGIVRQWARTGSRPRQPKDQRYQSAYLFGAVCPARGTGAAVAMPFADTHAMPAHLEEISRTVADGSHAVLLMDRAGWHTTTELEFPDNITPLFLPPRSPEPDPRPKTSGSTCARPTCRTASSTVTKTSSMRHATPGTSSSTSPRKSCRLVCANGHTKVKFNDRWYKVGFLPRC